MDRKPAHLVMKKGLSNGCIVGETLIQLFKPLILSMDGVIVIIIGEATIVRVFIRIADLSVAL